VGGFRTGSAGALAAAVAVVGGLTIGSMAPAYADDTVTVQGTAFPDPARAQLSLVGCADLYQRTDEALRPMVGLGPGAAPAGSRSLGFDLAGGNAVGALFTVDSMLSTSTASLAVNAADPSTGVAYAGYQEPADAGGSLLWLGRSELVTPGGVWQTVEATTRTYTWTKYDMTNQQRVADGGGVPTKVSDFARAHGGDGPGVYTIGFGCDGTPFNMDVMRVGTAGAVRTYDIEGLRTIVTIAAQQEDVREGDKVTISGRLHTRTGATVPHATMILDKREAGSDRWTPVLVAEVGNGVARATVNPDGPTHYRWRFVSRPLAEGSTSIPLLLDVLPPLPTNDPDPTPTSTPSSTPGTTPSSTPSSSPSSSPSEQPSSSSPSPSDIASQSVSSDPSGDAPATDSPGGSPSSSPRHR
jgi:hypothetical protein